ncbi:hypothetical protein [Pedobacter sp. Leaf176]|uniref:baeRF7 domain-containing protein n=1 Tax=Pedobacter sp. Leaf176 TaxID=1736286 RepID=UPI0006F7B20B|nr:hypothetical protein [Pedobacter sp. Leaf176]KQR67730.1 hypothetical protein ASF92_18845 [Pedobacter sp. Leaf176]
MDIITKEDFNELLIKPSPCISIFMPTHRFGHQVNEKQDSIVFKNHLQSLEKQLKEKLLSTREIEQLLAPAYALYKDEAFWNYQNVGLAIYLAKDFIKTIHLPYVIEDALYLNDTFNIAPLIEAISNKENYYVLTLSKHDAKFYQGNAFALSRYEVVGLPNGMDDVVQFEEKEGKQLFRQGSKGGSGSANFHGHGEGTSTDKDAIITYLQEVDRTLFAEVLHDKNSPLLLAGVEYLLPIYKSISKYAHIVDEVLTGNHDFDREHLLFDQVKELMTPHFTRLKMMALNNYHNQIATALTASMPETILPASRYARVDTLFVSKGQHIWGKFNETDGGIEIHKERQPGDECLINRAIVNTFTHGGEVYCLPQEEMPYDSVIAASLRF